MRSHPKPPDAREMVECLVEAYSKLRPDAPQYEMLVKDALAVGAYLCHQGHKKAGLKLSRTALAALPLADEMRGRILHSIEDYAPLWEHAPLPHRELEELFGDRSA